MHQPNGHPNAPRQPGGSHAPNGDGKSSGAKLLAIVLGAGVAIAGIAIGASQSSASPSPEVPPRIDLAAAERAAVVDPAAKVDSGPGENKADDAARVADAFLETPPNGPNALITTSGPELAVRVGPATRYLRSGTVASGTSVVVSCSLAGEALDGRYGRTESWSYVPALGGFVTDGFVYTTATFTAPDCREGLGEATAAEGSPQEGTAAEVSDEASVEGSDGSAGDKLPVIPTPESQQAETVTEVVTTTAEAEPADPETMTVTETEQAEPVVQTEYVEGEPADPVTVVQTEYQQGEPAEPVTVVQTEYAEPQVVEVTQTAVETARTTDTEYVVDTEWVAKTTTEHATKTVEKTATVTATATVTKSGPKPTLTATASVPTATLPNPTKPTGTKPTTTKPTTTKPTTPEKPDSCRSFDDQRSCAAAARWATAHINSYSSSYKGKSDRVAAMAYGLAHSGSYSAIDHWRTIPAKHKKKADRTVPAGGLAFFSGGKTGHVMISLGDDKFLSTDTKSKGRLSVINLKQAEKSWGEKYQGWSQPWFESNPH